MAVSGAPFVGWSRRKYALRKANRSHIILRVKNDVTPIGPRLPPHPRPLTSRTIQGAIRPRGGPIMVARGRVQNGVVVLAEGVSLPEGQEVTVLVPPIFESKAHSILDIPPVSVG